MGDFVSGAFNALGFGDSGNQAAGQQNVGQYGNIKTILPPKLEALKLAQMGPSSVAGIKGDQLSKGYQDSAMSNLAEVAANKGLTPSDMAQMQEATNATNINERGSREAILQNARMRGLNGSGNTLAAQLANSQGGQNRLSNFGTDLVANAGNRSLNAASQLGSLSTGVEGQRFGEQNTKASAADMIKLYNNQIKNQNQIYNKTVLPQTNFSNQMEFAGQKGNAVLGLGTANQAADQQKLKTGKDILGGAMSLFSDVNLKKDIKPIDMKEFLDSISASEYEYKSPSIGKGKHAGPMAQELEKTKIGKSAVMNSPLGKMVHPGKAAMLALASAKDLHERIKKIESRK